MRYREFKSARIPLGSGVTEAACKTGFTQRLKCSALGWSHQVSKTILALRTILLSKSGTATYQAVLKNAYPNNLQPYRGNDKNTKEIAA